MLRKRMTWWLSAALAVMLMVLTGCQTIQGLDVGQALLNNATLQSASAKTTLQLDLVTTNSGGLSAEDQQAIEALNHAKLELRNIQLQDKMNMSVDGALTYGKGSIPFQMTWNGKAFILQVEGAKKPFSIHMAKGFDDTAAAVSPAAAAISAEMQQQLIAKMNELMPALYKFFITNLPNPEHISVSSVTDTVYNETLALQKVQIEIKGSELLPLLKAFLTNVAADEKGLKEMLGHLYDILVPVIKESMKASAAGEETHSEYADLATAYLDNKTLAVEFLYTTINQMLGKQLKDWDKNMEQMRTSLSDPQAKAFLSDQTTLKADLYIDGEKQIRKVQSELTLPIADPSSGVSAVKLAYTNEIWNINKPVKAAAIDVSGGTQDLDSISKDNGAAVLGSIKKDSPLYNLLRHDLKIAKQDIRLLLSEEEEEEYSPYDASHPYINEEGAAMVPVRFLSERLGAEVKWDAAAKQIKVEDALTEKTLVLTLDSTAASVNGASVQLDSAPVLKNGAAFVPLRFIAEQLGCKVAFDEDTYSVNISRE